MLNKKNVSIMVGIIAVIGGVFLQFLYSAKPSKIENIDSLLHARLLHFSSSTSNTPTIEKTIGEQLGSLTLINFWASWCPPCRSEMPLFESTYQQYKQHGFTIIGVAIDNPDIALPMLDSMGISYPNLFAQKIGMTLMEQSGNPQGHLPYSILVNDKGEVLEQKIGQLHQTELSPWIEKYLHTP